MDNLRRDLNVTDPTKGCRPEVMTKNGRPQWPGTVVLSSSMQLLHINQRAMQLNSRLVPAESGGSQLTNRVEAILSSPLTTLASQILAELEAQTGSQPAGRLVIPAPSGNFGNSILIRGFGLPGSKGVLDARIVLILTEAKVNPSESPVFPQARSKDSPATMLT